MTDAPRSDSRSVEELEKAAQVALDDLYGDPYPNVSLMDAVAAAITALADRCRKEQDDKAMLNTCIDGLKERIAALERERDDLLRKLGDYEEMWNQANEPRL